MIQIGIGKTLKCTWNLLMIRFCHGANATWSTRNVGGSRNCLYEFAVHLDLNRETLAIRGWLRSV